MTNPTRYRYRDLRPGDALRACAVVAIVLLLAFAAMARADQSRLMAVLWVLDGDSLVLSDFKTAEDGSRAISGRKFWVELSGIDAPEFDQPYGEAATEALIEIARLQMVEAPVPMAPPKEKIRARLKILNREQLRELTRAKEKGTGAARQAYDRIERLSDIGRQMVSRGLAWSDCSNSTAVSPYAKEEAEAREARRGLWADPNPVPPWEWQKRKEERAMIKIPAARPGQILADITRVVTGGKYYFTSRAKDDCPTSPDVDPWKEPCYFEDLGQEFVLDEVTCPKKDEPDWQRGRRQVFDFVDRRPVFLEIITRGYNGLASGNIKLADGRDLASELIKAGVCTPDNPDKESTAP